MTEIASPYIARPRILVLGVQPGTPPFRIVEIDGQVVGEARDVTDVLQAAAAFGITCTTWTTRRPSAGWAATSSPGDRTDRPGSAAQARTRRACTARLIRRPSSR
ncbi:hypothetical protein SFUMM280S_10170 [Streptomyces fumanus]